MYPSHTVAEQPFRSTLDVAVEASLRRLAVEAVASAQNISDAMTSRADLHDYLLESERRETSSSPQSLSDDHFDATPAHRSDSVCARSGDAGEHIVDVSVHQDADATKVFLNPHEAYKMARNRDMSTEIDEKNDDHKMFYEQFGKCSHLGNHDDSTIRVKIAELLRLNASESEDEQLNLKEYVDLMKVQMRNDLIKDFADPLNKRIDDLTAQHHGLSQRVAQLESRQHVIVDEARRGQDRGETLRTEVTEIKRAVSRALTRLRAATIKEFEMIARLETQAIDAYNDAHQEIPQVQYIDKIVDVPVATQGHVLASQTVQKTVEMPQVQFLDRVLDASVVTQRHVPQEQIQERIVEETIDIPVPHVMEKPIEVVKTGPTGPGADLHREANYRRASFTDSRVQMQVTAVQVAQKTVKDPQTQSIVKELRSKFEVGHTNLTEKTVHGLNRSDKNQWRKKQGLEAKQYPQDVQERADLTNQRQVPAIRSVQKTVEVPKVQYIDKVADIPVDMQRQVSTIQAAQHIDEVVDAPALTQNEVPTIPEDPCLNENADEDRLEHENKKRRLPTPAEAVSESRADESDLTSPPMMKQRTEPRRSRR